MTVAPPEPAEAEPATADPAEPSEPSEPDKQPDLPDPAFPEVLPGGDPGPGAAPDPETQPGEAGS